MEYSLTHRSAFFDMKLRCVKIIAMQCRAERAYIIGHSRCVWRDRHIIAVHKVDVLPL